MNSLRYASCHAALSLPLVVGAYNKGYTVQPSARASPKFIFHFVPEKLRISRTLLPPLQIRQRTAIFQAINDLVANLGFITGAISRIPALNILVSVK